MTELFVTDLENMESFVLDHLAVVLQQIHAELQVFSSIDIRRHHIVVCSIQKYLPKEFDALPFGHVGVRLHQHCIVSREEEIEVHVQVMGHETLVLGEDFLGFNELWEHRGGNTKYTLP